ncbi:unnamed protein product [Schistosoma mattheei]|uniref:Uncharacterized protein n=1 Tax=Schistosoma mattheei TaxID=31246 RepID=A0A183PY82_9TREM|nr:unnamed protein product [Schistosoma mattheei]
MQNRVNAELIRNIVESQLLNYDNTNFQANKNNWFTTLQDLSYLHKSSTSFLLPMWSHHSIILYCSSRVNAWKASCFLENQYKTAILQGTSIIV